jgi:hypothetical protein
MTNIILQANLKESTILYEGKVVTLDEEKKSLLCQQLGSFWHNDKDYILLFEYYDDGKYNCERKKQIYDYRYREFSEKNYMFTEATLEQAKSAYDIFASFYEQARVLDLQKAKEEVQKKINEFTSILQINLRLLRQRMLSMTDWIFIDDGSVRDPEKQDLYRKYRQYLRDIPETNPEFESDPLNAKFPIMPEQYLENYPNKEVEYLSTPDQFTQYYFETIKRKLLRFQQWLSLPSTRIDWSVDGSEIELEDFKRIQEKIKKALDAVDTELIVPPLQFVPPVNTASEAYIDRLVQNAEDYIENTGS